MMRAAGLDTPETFPLLGGHEGAGIVERVGPGVTSLRPGDHVGCRSYQPVADADGVRQVQSYLCDVGARLFTKDMITDGTPSAEPGRRRSDGGHSARHVLGVRCRSRAIRLIKVDEKFRSTRSRWCRAVSRPASGRPVSARVRDPATPW